MSRDTFDPFEALGLPRDASAQTIKSRYHELARRYHPNRYSAPQEYTGSLSEHFHHVHRAWQLLSKAENRRKCVELLELLELQDEMLTHFVDLMNAESPGEQRTDTHADEHDGHISSDADEDLPHVGIKRRQTDLKRGAKHLGDALASKRPALREGRIRPSDLPSITTSLQAENPKQTDYFSLRRNKLSKLRRKELNAFFRYRNAMVAKFEAEEAAETLREVFEHARWKREYFERLPRETSERMRSFQHVVGAVRAFGTSVLKSRNRSSVNYGSMTPVTSSSDNQFLYPEHALARRKSVHRRGWSSDISGDQTSSDEDSADTSSLPRRISPPSRWNRQHVKAQGSVWTEWHDRLHRQTDTKRETQTPFQFVVKRPTDLGANSGVSRDSSPDSNSNPSRSPSPQVTSDALSFMWLPPSGPAGLFELAEDGRARSPDRRRPTLTHSADRDGHNSSTELCRFTTRQSGPPQLRHIPTACVYLLPFEVKARLLAADLDSDIDPAALLERLNQLDPDVASKFIVKADIKESFNFRLIYNHANVMPEQQQSFIALSYRRKLHVEKSGSHYTLPLDPEVFQAVWSERQCDEEGVWIDQICIDQESDLEKTISMSAMDAVYRSARLIVVALDDVELEAHEGALLQKHMEDYAHMGHTAPRQRFRRKQPPYLETHDDLFRLISKMLLSSWFRRAWCRHEMRLAKNHIFLIPCKSQNSWTGREVLRFNGKCLDHLLALSTEVPFERHVESVKPALHAFFRDRSKLPGVVSNLRHHHGNFTTVVAEVFDMEAGGDPRIPEEQRQSDARKDMVSIVLNTMECGLALHGSVRDPSVHLSLRDCFHDMLLLALATQDPGALCSLGKPLTMVSTASTKTRRLSSSWMHVPTVADSGLNNFKTLQRFSNDAQFHTVSRASSEYVQLDLLFFEPNKEVHPGDTIEMIGLAQKFMDVCGEKKWGRNRKRYLTHDRAANQIFGNMSSVYVETLACVFQCGPDWMSDVCQRYRVGRWKVDLQGAYELLIALKNTNGRWPVSTWSERAAGFIMDFVNFLVIRGLPQRQLTKPEKWRPIWVRTNASDGKVLTFIPVGNDKLQPAVPSALVHPDYVQLARLWTLEPRTTSDNAETTEWILHGKSVLFSDEISIEQMGMLQSSQLREQQKVFGRQDQALGLKG